jgi:hypothetical protein
MLLQQYSGIALETSIEIPTILTEAFRFNFPYTYFEVAVEMYGAVSRLKLSKENL